jgi:DNA-directed RNA polymerase specialized sigma24 family protein
MDTESPFSREQRAYELIPAALHRMWEIRKAVTTAANRTAPIDLFVHDIIDRCVVQRLRGLVRRVSWVNMFDDVVAEALKDLCSGQGPIFDPACWKETSHYLIHFLGRAADRLREREYIRLGEGEDGKRKRMRRYVALDDSFNPVSPAETDSDQLELAMQFWKEVSKFLKAREVELLDARLFKGLSWPDIAKNLQTTEGAATRAYARVIARLRERFSPAPSVTVNKGNMPVNQTQIVINGANFSPTTTNNTVVFSNGAVGTVVTATTSQLTVNITTAPRITTTGADPTTFTVVVTTNRLSSGTPVQIATLTATALDSLGG